MLCRGLDGVVARLGRVLLGRQLAMAAVVAEVLAVHALVGEQILGYALEDVRVLGEDALGLGTGLVEDVLDLLVDDGGGLLGIALGRAEVAADEDAVAGGVVADGAEPLAHAELHDHGAC